MTCSCDMYQDDVDDSSEMIGACVFVLLLLLIWLNVLNIKPFLIAWDKTISFTNIKSVYFIGKATLSLH